MLTRNYSSLLRRVGARAMTVLVLVVLALPAVSQAGFLDKLKSVLGSDGDTATVASADLSDDEIGKGLKEALVVGTDNVISQLGQPNGFNADPKIHIPLPASLDSVKSMLDKVGMGGSLDELELQMNRGAELAVPKAKVLFNDAIRDMTLDDIKAIYNGPDDSATRYFESKMTAPLAADMRPIVQASLADAGAQKTYGEVMDRYNALPFVPQVDADLSGYVVEKGMDGIFYYLAQEEAAIRQDPVKQTTALLKRVFGK